MEKILISACLLGENTRYDGGNNLANQVEALAQYYDLVPFCPEVEGGLSTPRNPSEIKGSSVYFENGTDVTKFFVNGAQKALNVCKFLGIRYAILKEDSPSCGVHSIHDGTFLGTKKPGKGITASLLMASGIACYSENDNFAFLIPSGDQLAEKQAKKDANIAKVAEREELIKEGATPEEADQALKEKERAAKPYKKFFGKPQDHYKKKPYAGKDGYRGHSRPEYKERTAGEEGASKDGAAATEKRPYSSSYRSNSHYGHSPYSKDGEHRSYGHSSYAKDGEHKDYGHSSYSKDGEHKNYGHSSYAQDGEHKNYGHSSYGKDGEHKNYGHSSYSKDGEHKSYGHSSYGEHKSYGHSSYGKDGEHKSYGHSSYQKDGEHKSYGRSSFHKDGDHKSSGRPYKKGPYRGAKPSSSTVKVAPKKDGDK